MCGRAQNKSHADSARFALAEPAVVYSVQAPAPPLAKLQPFSTRAFLFPTSCTTWNDWISLFQLCSCFSSLFHCVSVEGVTLLVLFFAILYSAYEIEARMKARFRLLSFITQPVRTSY